MGPINYTQQVANPFESALQGFQVGGAIRQQQVAQQQQEAAFAQQQQRQADLNELYLDPSPRRIAQISLKYPDLSENLKRSNDMLTADQQRNLISQAVPAYAAILSGQPQIASQSVRDIADAMEGSGQVEEAKHTRVIAELIEKSPQTAKLAAGSWLSSLMGPEKFAETFAKLGDESRAQELQPSAVKEANAKAESAATAAKFAESKAVMDLKLSQSQIEKMAADTQIARENARIAAINAATAREGNSLKKQELQLKLQEAIAARDEKLRNKVADVESARANMDNFLNTADQIVNTPLSTVKKSTGTIDSRLPTFDEDAANFEALVETLGSQAFLSQIPSIKGTGALSNAEGDKLQSALQNISLKQTGPRLVSSVREAQRLILKARENLATRYGVPDTLPDRPSVQTPGLPAGFKILGKE